MERSSSRWSGSAPSRIRARPSRRGASPASKGFEPRREPPPAGPTTMSRPDPDEALAPRPTPPGTTPAPEDSAATLAHGELPTVADGIEARADAGTTLTLEVAAS